MLKITKLKRIRSSRLSSAVWGVWGQCGMRDTLSQSEKQRKLSISVWTSRTSLTGISFGLCGLSGSITCLLSSDDSVLKESFFSLVEKRHVSHHSSPSLPIPTSFQAIAPMCHTPKSFSTWIRSNIYEKQLEISEFQMCGTKKWLDFSSWVLGFSWSRVKIPLGEKRGDHHVLRGEVPPCTNFGQIKQGSLQFGQCMMTWQPYPVSPVCFASPWELGTGCD